MNKTPLLPALEHHADVGLLVLRVGVGAFPAPCLLLIGLYLALCGSGRYGVDELISRQAAN